MADARSRYRLAVEPWAEGRVAVIRCQTTHLHADCLEPLEAALRGAEAMSPPPLLVVDLGEVKQAVDKSEATSA